MKEETLRKLMLACACMLAATALAGCGSDDSSSASSTDATTEETTTTTADGDDDDRSGEADVVSIVVVKGAPKGGIVRQTVSTRATVSSWS